MFRIFFLSLFLLTSTVTAIAAPKVVVSIKPIHSIVAAIMDGVGKPELLLDNASTPHDFNLKPSQAKSLQEADLIIWTGKALETFLTKPINNIDDKSKVLELTRIDKLILHEYRNEEDKHEEHDHSHDHSDNDPHIWLDVRNALLINTKITEILTKIDPENATQYIKNAKETNDRLIDLNASIKSNLKNHEKKDYIVFHDAYQYFEKHYGLIAPIAITIHPEKPLGASRVKEIKNLIIAKNISCLFSEPQFSVKIIDVIAENTKTNIAVIDPLGSKIEKGKDHYFKMMEQLATSFSECLKN